MTTTHSFVSFTDQTVVVTGAANGIGRQTATSFGAAGATLILVDLDRQVADVAAAITEDTGATTRPLIGDVSDPQTWDRIAALVAQCRGERLVLVNNAGLYRRGRVDELSTDDADLLYRVNQRSILVGVGALREELSWGGDGAVVNVSSTAGIKGDPDTSAYSATKWAVRGITKALAAELGGLGIRVNTVVPGLIATDMADANGPDTNKVILGNTFLGRIGSTREVAAAVLFLASRDASYISGSEIVVDGGLSV